MIDDSSSSPTIAPDGVFYAAYTRYNYSDCHMMHFSASGAFLNACRFGWDITPAIDNRGVIYMNSEDGFLYAFDSAGNLRETILLLSTGGQAYMPVAIDDSAREYAERAVPR